MSKVRDKVIHVSLCVLAAAAALTVWGAFCGVVKGQQPQPLWNWTPPASHHQAVVEVAAGFGDEIAKGSGTYVQLDGLRGVMTACHVIERTNQYTGDKQQARRVEVKWPDGTVTKAANWSKDREGHDSAFIFLESNRTDVDPIEIANSVPHIGQPLEVVGYGSGMGRIRHYEGRVSQSNLTNHFKLDANPIQGDSGGAILTRGSPPKFVGIVSAGDEDYTYYQHPQGHPSPVYRGLLFAHPRSVRGFLSRLVERFAGCPGGVCPPQYQQRQYQQPQTPQWGSTQIYPPAQPYKAPIQQAPISPPSQVQPVPRIPIASQPTVCPECDRIDAIESSIAKWKTDLANSQQESESRLGEINTQIGGIASQSTKESQATRQQLGVISGEIDTVNGRFHEFTNRVNEVETVAIEVGEEQRTLKERLAAVAKSGAYAAVKYTWPELLALSGPVGVGIAAVGWFVRRRNSGLGGASQGSFQ